MTTCSTGTLQIQTKTQREKKNCPDGVYTHSRQENLTNMPNGFYSVLGFIKAYTIT